MNIFKKLFNSDEPTKTLDSNVDLDLIDELEQATHQYFDAEDRNAPEEVKFALFERMSELELEVAKLH